MGYTLNFSVSIDDVISEVVEIGTPNVNYKRNGDVSSFEIDCYIKELGWHKNCKSSDIGILSTKVQTVLDDWTEKYAKHLQKKLLENTEATAQDMNSKLSQLKLSFNNILKDTLNVDDTIDWNTLKSFSKYEVSPTKLFEDGKVPSYIEFGKDGEPYKFQTLAREKEPMFDTYFKKLGWFSRTFAKQSIQRDFEILKVQWTKSSVETDLQNSQRNEVFTICLNRFKELHTSYLSQQNQSNDAVDKAKDLYLSGNEQSVEEYCDLVLSNSKYPDALNLSWKLSFNKTTGTIVIDYDLPSPENLPLVDSYKFVKAKNEIQEKQLTISQKTESFSNLIFQICIRTLHEIIEADVGNHFKAVAFNGHVTTLNKGTGTMDEKVILSILTSKNDFLKLSLASVDAEKAFRHLNGVAGKSLIELVPVPAVIYEHKKAG